MRGCAMTGMLRQQGRQADGFQTKFLPHEAIAARCFVAFVEEQVERLQDALQTDGQLVAGWNLERNVQLADALLCARQAFGDRGFAGQECARDFAPG